MTVFEVPDGTVCNITTDHLFCNTCKKQKHKVAYKALSTDLFAVDDNGKLRRFFSCHNPLCGCEEGVWLDTNSPANNANATLKGGLIRKILHKMGFIS